MMARNMHSSGAFSKRLSGSLNSWRQIRWLRSCRKYTRVEDKTSHQLSDKSNPLLPNAMFSRKKKGSIIILINTILSQAPSIPRHTPIELNPRSLFRSYSELFYPQLAYIVSLVFYSQILLSDIISKIIII